MSDNSDLLQAIADGRRADVPVPEPDDDRYRDDHDAARRLPLIYPAPQDR